MVGKKEICINMERAHIEELERDEVRGSEFASKKRVESVGKEDLRADLPTFSFHPDMGSKLVEACSAFVSAIMSMSMLCSRQ